MLQKYHQNLCQKTKLQQFSLKNLMRERELGMKLMGRTLAWHMQGPEFHPLHHKKKKLN
jgi:hypothetical protein